MNKWLIFRGDMPHKFLSKLNLKFDFLFLDSAHFSPGEFFNLIEALPFLNEKAIVVLHDTQWHLYQAMNTNYTLFEAKIMPTQIYLMSSLIGEKIVGKNKNDIRNIGAVCLAENQEKYYLNYFLLLKDYKYVLMNKNNSIISDKYLQKVKSYFLLGYDIIDPLLRNITGKKFSRFDISRIKTFPERIYFNNSGLNYTAQYQLFYFQKGDPEIVLKHSKDIILLHNSWTPLKFKRMSENEFLKQDILLSKLLFKILNI